ncbi:MAG: hypothetical protein B6245_16090 [Desulfobacteraceae bacterium 4572_88]|nr:MAG: hypothetical protein B6245_16090 [Desulfobacteraceae bacterium 4572_88]
MSFSLFFQKYQMILFLAEAQRRKEKTLRSLRLCVFARESFCFIPCCSLRIFLFYSLLFTEIR